jgi:hypothetical protein
MQIDVSDVLGIAAIMVFVSVVLFGYVDPRRRDGLVYVGYRVDNILAVASIMVLLSLFLLWW